MNMTYRSLSPPDPDLPGRLQKCFPLWVPIAFACAVLALPANRKAHASRPSAEPLLGTYRFAGGQDEVRKVERAIDEGVEEMSFLIRGIASRRLKEPNLPSDELRILMEGANITVARHGHPDISAPATGRAVTWRNPDNGNELEVTHRVGSDGALTQRLVGDRGISVNVFEVDRSGRLTMKTTIEAEKLPSPIRFSTTYVRRAE